MGHTILHAATLIRIRPSVYHEYSPLQLAFDQKSNISHLRIFGCAVYVPIAPPQRTKMGPQRRLGIYVGYESPSIIRYLEPKPVMFLRLGLPIAISMRQFFQHYEEKRNSWRRRLHGVNHPYCILILTQNNVSQKCKRLCIYKK